MPVFLVSCIYDPLGNADNSNGSGNNSAKITSLKAVIEDPNVKNGDTIDLSSYVSIDNFDYTATINKSLTIKNGADLQNAALTVTADGVVLSDIHNASVTTSNSMKISGSSLSNLTIGGTSPLQNVISRGVGLTVSVEVSDTSADNIVIKVAEASLSLENTKAVKVEIDVNAAGASVSFSGENTAITSIEAKADSHIITNGNVSLPQASFSGNVKVSTITMTDDDKPSSISVKGMPTTIFTDQVPNFAGVSVIGEYDLSDDSGETMRVIKTIKNYTIKIGNDVYYENGKVIKTDKLEAKLYTVIISAGEKSQSEMLTVMNRSGESAAENPDYNKLLDVDLVTSYSETIFDLAESAFIPDKAELLFLGNTLHPDAQKDVTVDYPFDVQFKNATTGLLTIPGAGFPFTYQEISETNQIICTMHDLSLSTEIKCNGTFIINISDDHNTIEILPNVINCTSSGTGSNGREYGVYTCSIYGTFKRFPFRLAGRKYKSTKIILNNQDVSNQDVTDGNQISIEFNATDAVHSLYVATLSSSGSININEDINLFSSAQQTVNDFDFSSDGKTLTFVYSSGEDSSTYNVELYLEE